MVVILVPTLVPTSPPDLQNSLLHAQLEMEARAGIGPLAQTSNAYAAHRPATRKNCWKIKVRSLQVSVLTL